MDGNVTELLTISERFQVAGTDFRRVCDNLLTAFHQLALVQKVSQWPMDDSVVDVAYAARISAEDLQLYYEMTLKAKSEFAWVPNATTVFNMLLLRLVTFRPFEARTQVVSSTATPSAVVPAAPVTTKAVPVASANTEPAQKTSKTSIPQPPVAKIEMPNMAAVAAVAPVAKTMVITSESSVLPWFDIVAALPINGLVRIVAQHCLVKSWKKPNLALSLDESQELCLAPTRIAVLEQALSQHFGFPIKLDVTLSTETNQSGTPAAIAAQRLQAKKEDVQADLAGDLKLQQLMQTFDATVQNIEVK